MFQMQAVIIIYKYSLYNNNWWFNNPKYIPYLANQKMYNL